MAQKVKIVGGPSAKISHALSSAVPAGATVLCTTGGGSFPSAADAVVPTVAVHCDQAGEVYFLVAGQWLRPDGSVAG